MYYVFDGTYVGFLNCIFESFERKEYAVTPISNALYQSTIFQTDRVIHSDIAKAKRIKDGLLQRQGADVVNDFFRNFLSEDPKAWLAAFNIAVSIFKGNNILDNYGNDDVLYFSQTLKKISREAHRMKAFIRFSKSSDGLFFALIEPDFNVLPLIANFFKNRYTDQPWLIFDAKRKYGLMFDTKTINEVEYNTNDMQTLNTPAVAISLDERDELFQRLWQLYFKSTNITARKNLKLHLQHVPKRYWKYLVEKQ